MPKTAPPTEPHPNSVAYAAREIVLRLHQGATLSSVRTDFEPPRYRVDYYLDGEPCCSAVVGYLQAVGWLDDDTLQLTEIGAAGARELRE